MRSTQVLKDFVTDYDNGVSIDVRDIDQWVKIMREAIAEDEVLTKVMKPKTAHTAAMRCIRLKKLFNETTGLNTRCVSSNQSGNKQRVITGEYPNFTYYSGEHRTGMMAYEEACKLKGIDTEAV